MNAETFGIPLRQGRGRGGYRGRGGMGFRGGRGRSASRGSFGPPQGGGGFRGGYRGNQAGREFADLSAYRVKTSDIYCVYIKFIILLKTSWIYTVYIYEGLFCEYFQCFNRECVFGFVPFVPEGQQSVCVVPTGGETTIIKIVFSCIFVTSTGGRLLRATHTPQTHNNNNNNRDSSTQPGVQVAQIIIIIIMYKCHISSVSPLDSLCSVLCFILSSDR